MSIYPAVLPLPPPDIEHPAGHPGVDPLQPGEPAGRVEMSLDRLEVGLVLDPAQSVRGPAANNDKIWGGNFSIM